jgi:SnoaL-like domain
MKKIFFIAFASLCVISCNNQTSSESSDRATNDASTEKIDYAYQPDGHAPDYWVPGDMKNAAMALSALKGWETGNMEQMLAPFADSVRWAVDDFNGMISKDTLRAWMTGFWKNTNNVKVTMDDYESVIGKDKKQQWVTVWYKQVVTGKDGKVDSAAIVDDLKFENGKITVLDEKSRKYPAPKK